MFELCLINGQSPDVRALWKRGFGDNDAYLDLFFSCLPNVPIAAARQDGHIVSMAMALDGLTLRRPGMADVPMHYAYCVTTLPEYRGKGMSRAIMRCLAARAQQRGALLCWRPASQSLAAWYAGILPVQTGFPLCQASFMPADGCAGALTATPIEHEMYSVLRERLLADQPHVTFPLELLHFQQLTGKHSGGGLWRLDGPSATGCAATERDTDGTLLIRELLVSSGAHADGAAALLQAHGAQAAQARFPVGADAGLTSPTFIQVCAEQPPAMLKHAWFGFIFD